MPKPKVKKPVFPEKPITKMGPEAEWLRKGTGHTVQPTKAAIEEIKNKANKIIEEVPKKTYKPINREGMAEAEKFTAKQIRKGKGIGTALKGEEELGIIKKIGKVEQFAKSTIARHSEHLSELAEAGITKLPRRIVGSVGGKLAGKVIGSTLGRAVAPVAAAMDIYTIGQAAKEGYKAYQAGKEYKDLYEKMKNKKYKPAVSPSGKPTGL